MKTFEFEVTYRCNVVCKFCNRLVGVISLDDSDLTIQQVRYAARMLRKYNYVPSKIKLSGGEPRMNPLLNKIRNEVRRQLRPRKLWTLTNGFGELPVKFDKIADHSWHRSPIPKQHHDPFLVSPTDCGFGDQVDPVNCNIKRRCGRVFDAYGFSFCPIAPMLGRILRINPYRKTPYILPDPAICKHCPDSIPEEPRQELYQIALKGNYPSKTLREGLITYKRDPFILPRLNVPKSSPKQMAHQ